MSRLRELIGEIHRRSLWQVLGIYVVGGWLVLQVVDTLAGALNLPDWAPSLALFLLIIGLPIVMATAFVQEGVGTGDPAGRRSPHEGAEASGPAHGRLLSWRNAITGGVLAFALLGVVSAAWMLFGGEGEVSDSGPPVSANTVAVLPFTVRGSDDLAYLSEGMVSLLSTKLDGAGDLRSVDARALLGHVERDTPGALDVARGGAVAARFGAGRFVMGDVVEAAGRLRFAASLYALEDSRRGSSPMATSTAEGGAEEIFELVDKIAAELLQGLATGPAARVREIARVTTSSLDAFKAYLEGESAFRGARFGPAVEAFQRAVELDSLYALAHYRLSVAAEWATRVDLSVRAAEAAARHAVRLSERDRRLLDAHIAWRRGAHTDAESRYRSFVGSYPDDVEAWFQLGEVLFHANPLHGRPFVEARQPFERVVSYEPDHAPALIHLARIAARERRVDDVASLVASALALSPGGDREAELRTLRAFSRDDAQGQDSLIAWLRDVSDVALVESVWDIAAYNASVSGLYRSAALLTDETRAPEVRSRGHKWRAAALLALGRWREAQAELDALERGQALEHRTFVALLPYAPVEESDRRALRRELDRLDVASIPESGNPSFFFSAHEGIHEVVRQSLLGRVAARLGDRRAALSHASTLDTLATPPAVGSAAADMAQGIRAELLRLDGRPAEALAELERMRVEIFYHKTTVSPFIGLVHERFLRAELLRELGRDREALRWYETLVQENPAEMAYLPLTHLRRAEIHERLGELDAAREQYAVFLELWAEADKELRSWTDGARERLEDIRVESD